MEKLVQVVEAPYEFTDEEKNSMAKQVTELELKVSEIEDEKKLVNDKFNEQIKAHNADILALSRRVHNGFESRPYKCRVEKDRMRKMVVYRDNQSEKIVKEVPFNLSDFQDEFPTL